MLTLLFSNFVFFVGCDDGSKIIEIQNSLPTIEIQSHGDDGVFDEGYEIQFYAQASDLNHENEELQVAWYANDDLVCDWTTPDPSGVTRCNVVMQTNMERISVQVVDEAQGANRDEISVVVNPTHPPQATIFSPQINQTYYSDQLISFSAHISDAEDDASELSVQWSSSLDGDLSLDTTPDSSGQIEDFAYLTQGEHAVKLTVTDTTGKTTTESAVIEVRGDNVIPSCFITEPTDGSSSVVGETIVFRGSAIDDDIANSDLSIKWKSDKDGDLGSSIADSSGDVSFAFSGLTNNTHTITLHVTDEVGGTCTDSILLTVGTPPSLQVQSPINNDVFSVGTAVFFTAVVSDQEDLLSELNVSWESSIDGVLPSINPDSSGNISFNSSVLSAGLHSLSIVATDTSGLTATSNLSFRINTPPTTPTVSISPPSPLTSDTLSISVSGSTDADGDTITYEYLWLESGIPTSYTSSTLPNTATSVGQEWSIQVTPKDQYTSGNSVISESVTVINSLPEVSNVQILPNPVYNDSTVSCSAIVFDGDESLSATYEWTVLGNSYVGATLDLSSLSLSPEDEIFCTATAIDSLQAEDSQSTSLIIGNRQPQIDSLTTSSSIAYTNSELDCIAVASDIDGQIPDISYNWLLNGNSIGDQATILLEDLVQVGDQLVCEVTVDDSYGGQTIGTLNWNIDNSLPIIDAMNFDPSEPFVDSEMICEIHASDIDEDGSAFQYTFAFTNTTTNDVYTPTTTNANQATLDLSTVNVQVGDVLSCSSIVEDSNGGMAFDTQQATIINKGPQFDSPATITPNTGIVVGTELLCEAIVSDYIDGNLNPDFRWLENGQEVAQGSTYIVDHSDAPTGSFVNKTLTCEVFAENSQGESATSTASVLVENTAPTVASVVLQPNSGVYNDDTLTCITTVTDADGIVTPTFEWFLGATNLFVSSNTIELSNFSILPNDIVECRVTVDDGIDSDSDSASIQIANRDPVVTNITISPEPAYNTDILNCTALFEDADGGSLSDVYSWEDGNSNNLGSGTTLDLNSTNLSSTDIVVCKVSVTDGIFVIQGQTQIELSNRAPTIASVSISPNPATTSNDLLCSYSGEQDLDGNAISVSYAWYVEGVDQGNPTDTLLAGNFAKGQNVSCAVTPYDNIDYGAEVLDSIVISNEKPSITSLSIVENAAMTNDTLHATYTTNDADGDAVGVDFIWVVDGIEILGQGDSLDGSVHFEKGQTVLVKATPNDGIDDGSEVSSATITIENTPPSDPVATIAPSSPVVGIDTVYCEITSNSLDDDNDSLTYSITWNQNGNSFTDTTKMTTTSYSNDSILATATTEGETWECLVVASDGTDNSNTVTSSATIAPPFTGNGSWTTSTESIPYPSVDQSAIWDEGNSRVLLFGGQQYYQLGGELLEYNPSTETWAVITANGITPPAITGQASAYDASTGMWYLFGGQSYYYLSDELFVLDTTSGGETWSEWLANGNFLPEPRVGASAVFDDLSQKFYVIGGQGYYGLLDDIWYLDIGSSSNSSAVWEEIVAGGTAPIRTEATTTLDPDYGAIYVIGGQSYYQLADDVACFDIDTQTWTTASLTGDSLPPMKGAASVWSDYIGGIIITGGQSYYRLVDSVYVIRPSDTCEGEVTEVNITSGSILPVFGASLLHDSINREAILVGGQSYYQLSPTIANFTP